MTMVTPPWMPLRKGPGISAPWASRETHPDVARVLLSYVLKIFIMKLSKNTLGTVFLQALLSIVCVCVVNIYSASIYSFPLQVVIT